MGFSREALQGVDARSYYEAQGLNLSKGRKWVTGNCPFHGGSDSLRINMQNGALVCMAGCGARGGDVLGFHMAALGMDFAQAAKALGCWLDDGKPAPTRPAPLSARDALMVLGAESNLVAIAAGNLTHGVALTGLDLSRLLQAAGRIQTIAGYFA